MVLIILCGYGRLHCVNSARKGREIGYENINIVFRFLDFLPRRLSLVLIRTGCDSFLRVCITFFSPDL